MLSTKPRYMLTQDGRFVRFFRFEDLEGKPEPASWGPCYPKTASAAVEKWRRVSSGRELSADEKREYGRAVGDWIKALNAPKRAPNTLGETTNAPSGQTGEFSAAKHRAKMRAALHAQAANDRRAWALGQAKNDRGETIHEAYARAMAEKAARLAGEPVREPGRLNPQPDFKPVRRPRKAAQTRKAA